MFFVFNYSRNGPMVNRVRRGIESRTVGEGGACIRCVCRSITRAFRNRRRPIIGGTDLYNDAARVNLLEKRDELILPLKTARYVLTRNRVNR